MNARMKWNVKWPDALELVESLARNQVDDMELRRLYPCSIITQNKLYFPLLSLLQQGHWLRSRENYIHGVESTIAFLLTAAMKGHCYGIGRSTLMLWNCTKYTLVHHALVCKELP